MILRRIRGRRGLASLLAAVGLMVALAGCSVQSADEIVGPLPGIPTAVTTGDFDGDGLTDVLLGFTSGTNRLFELQQDDYGFWSRQEAGTPVAGGDLLTVTDLDGNGAADVIAAGKGLDVLNVLRNQGDGSFVNTLKKIAPTAPEGSTQITALASATAASGKRLVAVAFATADPNAFVKPRSVVVYEAKGGGLTAVNPFQFFDPVPGDARELRLFDLDRDGRLDLVIGTASGEVQIYRGTAGADGEFDISPTTLTVPGRTAAVSALAAGEVQTPANSGVGALGGWTVDGKFDLVVGFADSADVFGWRGQGGMAFEAGIRTGKVPVGGSHPIALIVDSSGSGEWGGLGSGTPAGFFETDEGFQPAIFKVGTPEGDAAGIQCQSDVAALFANAEPPSGPSLPAARFAVAAGCKAPLPTALMMIPNRSRLGVPAEIDLGSRRAGTSGPATDVQLRDPDVASVINEREEQVPAGLIFLEELRITGPDAGDFSVSGPKPGCNSPPFCEVRVSFAPRSPGPKQATLVIESNAYRAPGAPPHSVPLRGTGTGAIAGAPGSVALGDVAVGETGTAPLEVTNSGNEPLLISDLELENASPGWSVLPGSCAEAVPPGSSCSVEVTVTPAARGPLEAGLTIASNGLSSPNAVALSANGIQGALAAPAAVELGSVQVGFSAERQVTLGNEGDAPLDLGQLAVEGPVGLSADTCSSRTLAVGGECEATVRFAPSAAGPQGARLLVPNDGESGERSVALSGTGLPADDPGPRPGPGPGPVPGPARLGLTVPDPISVKRGKVTKLRIDVTNPGGTVLPAATLRVELPPSLRRAQPRPLRAPQNPPASTQQPQLSPGFQLGPIAPGASASVTLWLRAKPSARRGAVSVPVHVEAAGLAPLGARLKLRIR